MDKITSFVKQNKTVLGVSAAVTLAIGVVFLWTRKNGQKNSTKYDLNHDLEQSFMSEAPNGG